MSADGSIELMWGDDTYTFRLGIGELKKLQAFINRPRAEIGAPLVGPQSLLAMIEARDAWPQEVREILRLGLIGGGMKDGPDLRLVLNRHFDEEAPFASYKPAFYVLAAALVGVKDDPVGKPNAEEAATEVGTTLSPSPNSTESGLPSDGMPGSSIN
jgi:hypothetical protein